MAGDVANDGGRRAGRWRMAAWAALIALVVLVPLIAMQFTEEVAWDAFDFVFAGVMVAGVAVIYELAIRMTGNLAYRAAVAVALGAAFMLIWVSGAVGIIGTEDNDANLMYGGVLAVAVIVAVIARFRPDGMARAMFATALAQALVAVIALAGGLGSSDPEWPRDILGVTVMFLALWLASAWLFRTAARQRTSPGNRAAVPATD